MEDSKEKELPEIQYCYTKQTLIQRSIDEIKEIARELVEWAYNDNNALTVVQFRTGKRIGRSCWFRWIERFHFFKVANELALEIIGVRREIGAIKNEYNSSTVMNLMPMYNEDYKKMYEWKVSLRTIAKHEDDKSTVVVIERYPESKLVPDKTKDTDENNECRESDSSE